MSRILVVNAGSTSLKLSIVDEADTSQHIDSYEQARTEVEAAAHRVVHGGTRFYEPVVLDADVETVLDALVELAPLHNRPALAAIREAMRVLPHIPHVAVFDTAFHRTIPAEASTYALPLRWRDEWGVRRFGFHGLSVQSAAERVRVPRLVVCHLGGGCSVTAVRDGRSVDTTMGFSPLEGVPMATRSGSIDAEIVLHLLRTGKLGLAEIEHALESESGLLGLSGETERVEQLERSSSPAAQLALRVFTHRVAASVASMAASLDGIDALVFTAGIGEGSASVRRDVCRRLGFLGVELDVEANAAAVPDVDVNAQGAAVRIVVLHAREDVVAARAARLVVSAAAQPHDGVDTAGG
ncbi:MAG TPA: acetate/propionate family kinase [Gaiellaceae bacterium]